MVRLTEVCNTVQARCCEITKDDPSQPKPTGYLRLEGCLLVDPNVADTAHVKGEHAIHLSVNIAYAHENSCVDP